MDKKRILLLVSLVFIMMISFIAVSYNSSVQLSSFAQSLTSDYFNSIIRNNQPSRFSGTTLTPTPINYSGMDRKVNSENDSLLHSKCDYSCSAEKVSETCCNVVCKFGDGSQINFNSPATPNGECLIYGVQNLCEEEQIVGEKLEKCAKFEYITVECGRQCKPWKTLAFTSCKTAKELYQFWADYCPFSCPTPTPKPKPPTLKPWPPTLKPWPPTPTLTLIPTPNSCISNEMCFYPCKEHDSGKPDGGQINCEKHAECGWCPDGKCIITKVVKRMVNGTCIEEPLESCN